MIQSPTSFRLGCTFLILHTTTVGLTTLLFSEHRSIQLLQRQCNSAAVQTVKMADLPSYLPPMPPPFSSPNAALQLVTQGAEAIVLKTALLTSSTPVALKFRPKKSYRHPTLDARLTKARVLAEARVLIRCKKEAVQVPAVIAADWEAGWLALEWIPGQTVRACLDAHLRSAPESEQGQAAESPEILGLMSKVGSAVGRLHSIGIVHGDLTTSNLMLRQTTSESSSSLDGDVYLIDFGLAQQSIQDEDRAVDLYVLERAFGSTHPQAENLFHHVLQVYAQSYKGAAVVIKRLEEVRMRGRKKSMVG
jgi:TP53 regulating kinase and related kinases